MVEIKFQIFEGDRPFEHAADDVVGPEIDPGAAREMSASPIEG